MSKSVEQRRASCRAYYWQHREHLLEQARNYREQNRRQINAKSRARTHRRKLEVFLYYSNGTMECNYCGIDDVDMLCIDHIEGGGYQQKQRIPSPTFYRWLQKQNYPKGYQVLCFNCNFKKRITELRERCNILS